MCASVCVCVCVCVHVCLIERVRMNALEEVRERESADRSATVGDDEKRLFRRVL